MVSQCQGTPTDNKREKVNVDIGTNDRPMRGAKTVHAELRTLGLNLDMQNDFISNNCDFIPKLEDSKVPKVEDSKVPKLEDSKVTNLEDSKVPKLEDSKFPKLEDSKVPKIEDSKVCSRTDKIR
ncbi:hypothetical protein CHS0354_023637 [Potamilus streckersoni]|uniref:Uncharacterized protein n=1 Tax=Potamilus streckersoni TaxID=2493646 RepID=A0AAE0SZG8_9BIVA|nr:hypothetical protein CHS0354_023637 [Potamilus streckersoni]